MDYGRLPAAAVARVIELVNQFQLKSVGAEEHGVVFWQRLCEIQLQRAHALNCEPQEAFQLYASDMGVPQLATEAGGYIHVSYEGIVPGALTLLPDWREFFIDRVIELGNLGIGVGSSRHPEKPPCQILVTDKDFGEIPCANREHVGEWSFYIEKALMAAK